MFVKLSCKIADRLEHCGIISKSNRTLYEYGLRQMFATILNILTMLLIGFIMGLAVPAMVYTIAYIPLRVYAGGYHASTPQRCWAFSAIMLWIALCIVKYTPQTYFWVITTLSLIACIVVFLLSPVEDRKKRTSCLSYSSNCCDNNRNDCGDAVVCFTFHTICFGIGDCMVLSCSYVAAWKRKECF